MRLLFDQNISYKVPRKLSKAFPGCTQVRDLELENKSDKELWEFAKKEGFAIVTFDSDFYDLATLYGHPPKVIWLRTGNTNTDNLIKVLEYHTTLIEAFLVDKQYEAIGCLEINVNYP